MRHLLTLAALLLIALCTNACGYLDQEILLTEEDYMTTFDSEGVGGLELSGTGYSFGCGGGHGYISRRTGDRAHGVAALDLSALDHGPDAPSPTAASLAQRAPLVTPALRTQPDEEREETSPHAPLNHDLVTQIATHHAH